MAALSLADARALLDLDEGQLVARLGGEVERELRYEGLGEVDAVVGTGARVFLRDGRPVLVYLSEPEDVTEASLAAELGGPGELLSSRTGKTFNLHVHADQGVAYSADGDDVAFVEIFRPRSLAEYERDVYVDPGPFIR